MSDETQMRDALTAASGPLCDVCMTTAIGWSDPQLAGAVGSRMAEQDDIVRANGVCSRCGRRKTVSGLRPAAIGQPGSPVPATEEQKVRVIELLRDGRLDRDEIAAEAGVSSGVVAAIMADVAMGTYAGRRGSDVETDELGAASEVILGLERDLQAALRADLEQLEPGLRVVDDGRAREAGAGRIDITAEDHEGAAVVIELQAGTAGRGALTRLLADMDALAGRDQSAVRGVLVARDFHPRVVSAARA